MCKTCLTYSHVSRYPILLYFVNFGNKLLLSRLTLWWGEMNLSGQFSRAGSPGSEVPARCLLTWKTSRGNLEEKSQGI